MDALEVFAMDANRNRLTGNLPYKSLNWSRRYYEPGEFTLEIPRSMYSTEWAYIYAPERPETGIIQKVEVRDGESGWEDTVVLSGFFEESILNKRCFLNEYEETGLASSDNVATVTRWLRKYLPTDVEVLDAGFSGESKTIEPAFSYLGDVCFEEMQTIGASVRVGYDFESNKRTAQIWRGLDRTQSQSENDWVVFSEAWGNLSEFTASKDDSAYKNTCYVLYEYEEPVWGSDGLPVVDTVYAYGENGIATGIEGYKIRYTTKSGHVKARLNDGMDEEIETWLDSRSEKPSFDSAWSRDLTDEYPTFPDGMKESYDAYPEALRQQGISNLVNNFPVVKSFDSGSLDSSRYMVDYDLGDKVDGAIESIGLTMEALIVEADEVYDNSGASVALSVGDVIVRRNK